MRSALVQILFHYRKGIPKMNEEVLNVDLIARKVHALAKAVAALLDKIETSDDALEELQCLVDVLVDEAKALKKAAEATRDKELLKNMMTSSESDF